MLKNITLSADEHLIEKARKKAIENNTTLNELFRKWLISYSKDATGDTLESFMEKVSYVNPGRSFSRDEYNER